MEKFSHTDSHTENVEYGRLTTWKTICFSSTIEALLSDTLQPKNSGRPRSSEQELLMLADYLENN